MRRKWSDLSPRSRRMIVSAAVAEAALKIAVLVDLKNRPADQVRGSRRMWATSMVVNSFGLLPLAYFTFGRRPHRSGAST
jgi:hypothetical protein